MPDKTSAIFKACTKGDFHAIRKFIKKGGSLACQDGLGRTPLHYAVSNNQERCARTLLASGADPFAMDQQLWTPLHTACSLGMWEIAEMIIDAMEQRMSLAKYISKPDLISLTPLHLACISGNCSLVRALIRKGAKISALDANGRTPLDVAMEKKNEELIKTLRQTAEETSKKTSEQIKAVCLAIRKDDLPVLVKALFDGLDLNSKSEDNQSLLYIGACCGYKDIVSCLVGKGADINIQNSYSRTILHQLALEGNDAMFEHFLSLPNINMNLPDDTGKTVLFSVAEWGRTNYLKQLVANKIDLHQRDASGQTVLHLAAKYGKKAICSYLVREQKFNPNVEDNFRCTPLHYAARWRRTNIIKILLSGGAKVNVKDEKGNTPLHESVVSKYPNSVMLLLDHKADPTEVNADQRTPLHTLMLWNRPKDVKMSSGVYIDSQKKKHPLYTRDYQAHTEIAKMLIDKMIEIKKESINAQDRVKRTALHWAVTNRHKEAAELLIIDGLADARVLDIEKRTPLDECDQPLYPARIRQDILAAFDARAKKSKDQLPEDFSDQLFEQIEKGNLDAIKELAKVKNFREAIVAVQSKEGKMPLHEACFRGNEAISTYILRDLDLSSLLVNKQDNLLRSPLHYAAIKGHLSLCKLLLRYGADPKVRDDNKLTPSDVAHSSVADYLLDALRERQSKELFSALENKVEEIAKTIVEEGAPLDNVDKYGCQPLAVAAILGFSELCAIMIQHGADVNAIDENQQSALHWATIKGNSQCVHRLVDAHADLNAIDCMDQTPLHWAISKGHQDIAMYLIKRGANTTLTDIDGKTPFDLARSEEELKALQDYTTRLQSGPRSEQECTAQLFELLQHEPTVSQVIELLDEGADIHAKNDDHSSLLCLASIHGLYEVAQEFINRGCAVDSEDTQGQTALHWAASKGHSSVGQLLIDSNADPNHTDHVGQSPLHWAVIRSNIPFIKLLLRSGSDGSLKDLEGNSPQSLAKSEVRMIFLNRTQSTLSIARPLRSSGETMITRKSPRSPRKSPRSHSNSDLSVGTTSGDATDVVQSTVREMIHSVVQASTEELKKNPEKAEESIEQVVDTLLNQVQDRAEAIIDKTITTLAAIQAAAAQSDSYTESADSEDVPSDDS